MLSRLIKSIFQGLSIWLLLMLVITATWYLAATLAIAPFDNLHEPLAKENLDIYLIFALISLVFSFWVSSLNDRWNQLRSVASVNQKQLELSNHQLAKTKKQLDQQLQLLPIAIIELNEQFFITDCNRRACELLGGNLDQIVGESFAEFVSQGSREEWQQHSLQLFNSDNDRHFQIELQSLAQANQTKTVWTRIRKTVNFDARQNKSVILSLTDISDLHFAENYLQEAYQLLEEQIINRTSDLYEINERMALATDSAGLGIWDLNLKDQSLIWDKWMLRLHGLSYQDFDRKLSSWEKMVHGDDYERVHKIWQEAIEEEKPFDVEFRIVLSNGDIHWIKVNAICNYDKSGKPQRMIGTCRDITTERENELLIRQQADYDNLTGLPNRKLFYELLNQEIKQSRRDGFLVWVLFLDLDGFKEVNDTLGHHIGDLLLQKVAERLQSLMRNADIVSRLGGDEFVIILTDIDETTIVDHICQKIIDAISRVFRINSEEVYITASIGIANYPRDADNTADLLKFADQSMYVSKNEGKNRYSYFTPELQKASMVRKEVLSDLRRGIAEDHFQLYFQPIIDLNTGKVHKAEALLRWIHPDRGIISPADFIPVAEETGIIKDIGYWIFEHAFMILRDWSAALPEDFQLSINMSPVQLKNNDAESDEWLKLLNHFSLKGSNVVIEITEGLLLKNDLSVNDRLLRYSEAGIQVAIDDFGTGYSSLAYLQEFDIDYLKIDQRFIQKLQPGSNEESLSHAIVVMAQQLGLKVIAEGIETQEQADMLKKMGADYGQGYLFDKPLIAEEFFQRYLSS